MKVKLPFAIGLALAWLVAVASVSGVAWVAIDRAGRGVTTAQMSVLPPVPDGAAVVGTPSEGVPSPTQQTPVPPPAAGASRPPAAATGTAGTPSTTGRTAVSPSAAAQPRPSALPSTRMPPSTPTPSTPTPSAATPQDRTAIVPGGQISVRCIGANLTLRAAQPDNGWQAEVDRSGPDKIEVSFRRGTDDTGSETRVTAVCTGGTPTFTVESGR